MRNLGPFVFSFMIWKWVFNKIIYSSIVSKYTCLLSTVDQIDDMLEDLEDGIKISETNNSENGGDSNVSNEEVLKHLIFMFIFLGEKSEKAAKVKENINTS